MPHDYLEPKYTEPYQQWKARPDKTTTGQLLRALDPELKRGVNAYAQGDPLAKSKAKSLAIRALHTYDSSMSGLGTHLFNHMGGLRRFERSRQQTLSLPERMELERGRLLNEQTRLTDERGREPTLSELADATGIGVKRIDKILSLRPAMVEGKSRQLGEDDMDATMGVANDIGLGSDVWLRAVQQDLDPINQLILQWSLGMNGQPVLANHEIATRIGMTPGAVSQRKAIIQQVLDQEQDLSPF